MSYISRQPKPLPAFITERLNLYEELKKESDDLLAKKAADSRPITVTLPDNRQVPGKAWVTTPYQVACGIRLVLVPRDRSASM